MKSCLKIGEYIEGVLIDPKTGEIGGKIKHPEEDKRLEKLLAIVRRKIEETKQEGQG